MCMQDVTVYYFQLQSCGTHQLGKSYEQNSISGSSAESGIYMYSSDGALQEYYLSIKFSLIIIVISCLQYCFRWNLFVFFLQNKSTFMIPNKETIELLAQNSGGDIRTAINGLQFSCLKG